MNFSIILPTRGRVNLLQNLCRSVAENTHDLSNIEMLAACDYDDHDTCHAISELMQKYTWFRGFSRERGGSISRDYQNWLYPHTSGKYIHVVNDDVEYKTPGWDSIALAKIQEYTKSRKDGIFYGWTADSAGIRLYQETNAYACFPVISRTAIDILGYVMHEHYGGWSADVFMFQVYKEANSILDLSCILIQHYSHWLGNREKDEITESMRVKSTNTDIIDHRPESNKLLKFIKRPLLL